MFDQVGKMAERTVDSLSRRAFLHRLGLGAAAFVAFASDVVAAPKCVKFGGCCGGTTPYYNTRQGICCVDKNCQIAIGCGEANSTCGNCTRCGFTYPFGVACFQDVNCAYRC